MARPAQSGAVGAHGRGILRAGKNIAGNHAEFLREFFDRRVVLVGAVAVLVVYLVVWLLWHTDERAVVGILEVDIWHLFQSLSFNIAQSKISGRELVIAYPVIALVCLG